MLLTMFVIPIVWSPAQTPTGSVFLPERLVQAARANIARYDWARQSRDRIVERAAPWMRMSDDELWSLMFGNTIKRSWMVWSNGFCPACKRAVPMYTWEMDALNLPWKVRCPHCKEIFPKNDFVRFYRSGLDEHGVFDPKRADRSLLYNTEHPDPGDPLRSFGVDDGEGYVEGDKRWRFIGAYLIYGQWKQAILGGIRSLADAYTVTGDPAYAHRAGVLLDRVADLYPSHDFGQQGVMYEGPPMAGYVSTWHDACEETRQLALAYDQVRDALARDEKLVRFLSEKAARYRLENPKRTWADVCRNIEDGILRHPLEHRERIYSNYPRTEITLATLTMVLGWPGNRQEVFAILDPMLEKATAVDGVTGEKGLAGYSAFTVQGVALFLGQISRIEPTLLRELLQRHPRLRDMFRFHIDTWCLGKYYPQTGDTGGYASLVPRYVGVPLRKDAGMEPSGYDLLVRLAKDTGDPAFAQVAYLANERTVAGLPYDLFCTDPAAVQREVASVVRRFGPEPKVGSVNKEKWCLAILRSGAGADARAVWLDYDAGGAHGHADALNLGMFAFGLDLLPELGYPPVQFGGWGSPRARWYTVTAAHNTVVVDRQNQEKASGVCTLWCDGRGLRAVRAACPQAARVRRYERTIALCDVGPQSAYVVDVFRVAGGSEHVKFQQSHFGTLALKGVELAVEPDFGQETQMRAFRLGRVSTDGAVADWTVQDRLKLLPEGATAGLRHYELTEGAEVGTCEGWIAIGGYNATEELWIPRLVVRRRGQDLMSTFVAVLEPHLGTQAIRTVRRLRMVRSGAGITPGDGTCALEIRRANGLRDIVVVPDPEAPKGTVTVPEAELSLDGDLCRVTLDAGGQVRFVSAVGCSELRVAGLRLRGTTRDSRTLIELEVAGGRPRILTGKSAVAEVHYVVRSWQLDR